ncbi:reverse transcriptase domain-containing protein [Ixodes scapularis]
MYYSIPHTSLMPILRETIEEHGVTPFQTAAGINIDAFLELLGVYLTATVISYEGLDYVQKSGICIGSRVAPHLCDLFLAACGRHIQSTLNDARVKAIFRYVDDFLILCSTDIESEENGCRSTIMKSFHECCPDLLFTHELPVGKSIKFLDLALEFKDGHIKIEDNGPKGDEQSTRGIILYNVYRFYKTYKESGGGHGMVIGPAPVVYYYPAGAVGGTAVQLQPQQMMQQPGVRAPMATGGPVAFYVPNPHPK